ncbi:uncharacterized protein [Dermacentor andersoni]|uniref:uncharacterized protein n=1 Tax=Dermacentor andersoni TaxID=34620 RepID=UPI002416CF88|nr:uncharacterized protein LOC129382770 [Dermacentor andersoni]
MSPLESQSRTPRSASPREPWMSGDFGSRTLRRSGNVTPGTPRGCRTPAGETKKATETDAASAPPAKPAQAAAAQADSLASDEDDAAIPFVLPEDNSVGWFRIWVLCSVAGIVLIIPFGLTLLSYRAASRSHKFTTHRGHKISTPRRHPTAASGPNRVPLIYYDDKSGRPPNCQSANYSDVNELVLDLPVPRPTQPLPDKMFRKVFCVFNTMLRAQGLVCCTGGLNEASMALWAIRKILEPSFLRRVAYSIALGADTYFGDSKELWTPGIPLSRFYDLAQGTVKMSYKQVCKLPTVKKTDECVLSIAARNGSGYKMAAFAGMEQLRNRLVKSYYYEMAQLAVVIYDIELDDYEGFCENTKWPLIRALSEPFNKSLRHL